MAQVFFGDSEDFNAVAYSQMHPGTLSFLENQFNNIGNVVGAAAQDFMDRSRALFDQFNNSEAVRKARAAVQMVKGMFQRNEVSSLWDIEQIQQAPLEMQRIIMANPFVRKMYQEQRCDGYSETYQDMQPGAIGRDHYDWRRVMDGAIVDLPPEEGEDEPGWKVSWFFEEPVEGDRALRGVEKADARSTWDVVEALMKRGKEDLTSQYGSML